MGLAEVRNGNDTFKIPSDEIPVCALPKLVTRYHWLNRLGYVDVPHQLRMRPQPAQYHKS